VEEIYCWLAIVIYAGIHQESDFRSYWKEPEPGSQRPLHPVKKFMTFDRFFLLSRYLRISRNSSGSPFEVCSMWSDLQQRVSTQLWLPGTEVAVDESIQHFEGRAREKVKIPTKPTPEGLKIWVVAQLGYFLRWFFHDPTFRHDPLGHRALRRYRSRRTQSQRRQQRIYSRYLNPTQDVVYRLMRALPPGQYHVFIDNLFTSPALLLSLRDRGIGATGTCRVNCGLYEKLVAAKKDDTAGHCWPWNEIRAYPTPDGLVSDFLYFFPIKFPTNFPTNPTA
jgi:hypothetical protein